MFNVTKQLNRANGIFGKARKAYKAVVADCALVIDDADRRINRAEGDKAEAVQVQAKAQNSIEKINEIIGEE